MIVPNFEDTTLEFESKSASPISPNRIFTAKAGSGKKLGRLKAEPSWLANVLLEIGFGETRFMGPQLGFS